VIENGLIFILGGLTGLLVTLFFWKRTGAFKGKNKPIQDQNISGFSAEGEYSRIKEQNSVSSANLKILYDLDKALDSTLDTYIIMDQALSSAISSLGGDKADYYRYQNEDQTLSLVRSIGRDLKDINDINQELSQGEIINPLRWVLENKNSILLSKSKEAPLQEKISNLEEGVLTYLVVPVLIDQELEGMISLSHPEVDAYSKEGEDLLMVIAHQAGMAINNAQKFVEVAFLLNSLKAKQELQDKLFEHLTIGVLLLDNQYNILSGNQQGFDLVNKLQPDFNQISISQLGDKTIQEFVDLSLEPLPVEVKKEDHLQEIFEVQLRQAQTMEGQYWILMVADVTEERGIINRIRIQERLATVGQFAAGISHDFNNILSAILVYSDVMIRDSQLSDKNKSRVDAIREQSQRAADLISRILDFSRGQTVEHKAVDMVPFLKETRELITRVFPDHIQVRLEINSSSATLPILGDPTRLQQMIMNLALNSRDALMDGGTLVIQAEPIFISEKDWARYPEMDPGSWILIRVKDDGIGIDPKDQPRVFEPFFTTKASTGGTGLGLAQVYGIVKQHQGFIDMDSAPGIGTTFNIYLPCMEGEIAEVEEAKTTLDLDGEGELVLVVEDDENLKKAIWNLFEDHGFQVIAAGNGKNGLDIIRQIGERISLVITDVMMPAMGGVEMYQRVRELYPEKKFIFITGHPSKVEGRGIDEDPLARLLIKPFSMTDILHLTREIRDFDKG